MKKIILILLIVLTLSSCKSNGYYLQQASDEGFNDSDTESDVDLSVKDSIIDETDKNDVEENTNINENINEKETDTDVTEQVADTPTEPKEQTEPEAEQSTDETLIVTTHYTPITIKEMIEKSTLIVLCEFVRQVDVIQVNGRNYTNTEMNVTKTLRGETTQQNIIVRTDGGTAGGIMQINSDIPKFKSGEKYLLFLYNPGMNNINNTEGDHYFLSHATDGAMRYVYVNKFEFFTTFSSVNSASKSISADTLDTDSKDAIIFIDDFEQILEELNKTVPINPNYTREKELELYKQQYKQGNMSKAEYEQAIKEKTEYAVITDRVPF